MNATTTDQVDPTPAAHGRVRLAGDAERMLRPTLEEAVRVGYGCATDRGGCELVVHDAYLACSTANSSRPAPWTTDASGDAIVRREDAPALERAHSRKYKAWRVEAAEGPHNASLLRFGRRLPGMDV
jgi:hypothetical protein